MRPGMRMVMRSALLAVLLTCKPPANAPPPRSTLVVGLDVSGSFRQTPHFNDALDFAALYIYAHLHGLHGLRQATDIFVGSLGGERPGQPKTFHPIQDLTEKSPQEIEASLRAWFPETDPITDFNGFFQRLSVHIRRQNLVLAPLNVVMFTDGLPDFPGAGHLSPQARFARVDMSPLEYLSRSVSVRVLYVRPQVAQNWERLVKRQRVRIWTQDSDIMKGWRRHELPGTPLEQQDSLLSWMDKIVDFRVRRGKII
jgi:hypothetical protein